MPLSPLHRCVILAFIPFNIVVSAIAVPPTSLRHVNLLFRHGDRSPIIIFPNDINQIDVWPDGFGWLTNIGKQQQYELGKYLADRYGGFVNVTSFDHRQISVQSSAVDRCVMSALSNLAGMFPPHGDQIWNDNLLWQPIPIKTAPREHDNKVAVSAKCPRYDQLYDEMFKSQKATDYQKKNQKFFDMLSNHTGWKEKSTVTTTWKLIDPLVCEKAHNMTMNDFVQEDGVFDKLVEIQHFTWGLQYYTAEMAKLKGGPLLKEIIENMKAASNGSSGDLKLHMYSGHDSTVSALLSAMTVSNHMQPPYATLVMVELHTINNQSFVKIFFRNDTENGARYLLPKGCEDPCKLSTFQSLVADRIPHDWQEECKALPKDNASQPNSSSRNNICSGFLFISTLLFTLLQMLWLQISKTI